MLAGGAIGIEWPVVCCCMPSTLHTLAHCLPDSDDRCVGSTHRHWERAHEGLAWVLTACSR